MSLLCKDEVDRAEIYENKASLSPTCCKPKDNVMELSGAQRSFPS
jgi:hypothetical protein